MAFATVGHRCGEKSWVQDLLLRRAGAQKAVGGQAGQLGGRVPGEGRKGTGEPVSTAGGRGGLGQQQTPWAGEGRQRPVAGRSGPSYAEDGGAGGVSLGLPVGSSERFFF